VSGYSLFRIQKKRSARHASLFNPSTSPCALRPCFITRAIELGVDFKTISSWQGHQDGGVLIAKTYSHLRNEHSENMAKKLIS